MTNNLKNAKQIPFTSTWERPYFITVQGVVFNYKGKQLNGHRNKQGYICHSFSFKGKRKTTYVHSMLYSTFIDEIKDGYIIDHKDGNSLNNRLVNLQQITQKENVIKGKIKKYSDAELQAIHKTANYKEYISVWQNGISQGYYSATKNKKVNQ